jgi:hypothetical protein
VVVDVRDTFGLNVPIDEDRENVCESEGAVARSELVPVDELVPVGVVRERVPVLRLEVDRVDEAAREPVEKLLDVPRLLEVVVPAGETARLEVMSERRRLPVERDAVVVEKDRLDAEGEIRGAELEAAIAEAVGA